MNASASIFSAWATLAGSATAPAASSIPYRTQSAVSTGSFALALGVTALLLLLLFGLLFYLRRRGWIPGARMRHAQTRQIELLATQRVSMGVTAHVIAYREKQYFIIESARGSHAVLSPIEAAALPPEETP